MKTIITSGNNYVDIDALACAIGYDELLSLKNINSEVVFSVNPNSSVTKTIRNWGLKYSKELNKKTDDLHFVIVDCANPEILPNFVDLEKVIEVYDHHLFNEEVLWKKYDTKVIIEPVGACATLIWDKYKSENVEDKISKISANLLYTAIFSNTLNFNASVTTQRDIDATKELLKYTNLPDNWISTYYKESEEQTLAEPETAIKNDTKVVSFQDNSIKLTIGQMELWNSFKFIDKSKEIIQKVLEGFGNSDWFMTAPSISEGKNYIFTKSPKVKDILLKSIECKFDGDIGVTSKLWLRKEILKRLLN